MGLGGAHPSVVGGAVTRRAPRGAGGGDGGHPVLRPPALPPQHPESILFALLETLGPGCTAHMPSLDFRVQATWAGIPAPSFAVRSGKCLRFLEPQFPHL